MKADDQMETVDSKQTEEETVSLRYCLTLVKEKLALFNEIVVDEVKMSRNTLISIKIGLFIEYIGLTLLLYIILTNSWVVNGGIQCMDSAGREYNGTESLILTSLCRNQDYRNRFGSIFVLLESMSMALLLAKLVLAIKKGEHTVDDYLSMKLDNKAVFFVVFIPRFLLYLVLPLQSLMTSTFSFHFGSLLSILRAPVMLFFSLIAKLVTLPISIFFPYPLNDSVVADFSNIGDGGRRSQKDSSTNMVTIHCFESCRFSFEWTWLILVMFFFLNFAFVYWFLGFAEKFQDVLSVEGRTLDSRENFSDGVEFIRVSEVSEDFSYEEEEESKHDLKDMKDFEEEEEEKVKRVGEDFNRIDDSERLDAGDASKIESVVFVTSPLNNGELREKSVTENNSVEGQDVIENHLSAEGELTVNFKKDSEVVDGRDVIKNDVDRSDVKESSKKDAGVVDGRDVIKNDVDRSDVKESSKKDSEVVDGRDVIKNDVDRSDVKESSKKDSEVVDGRDVIKNDVDRSDVKESSKKDAGVVDGRDVIKNDVDRSDVKESSKKDAEIVHGRDIIKNDVGRSDVKEYFKEISLSNKGTQTFCLKLHKGCQTFVPIHLHKKINKKTQVSPIFVDAQTNTNIITNGEGSSTLKLDVSQSESGRINHSKAVDENGVSGFRNHQNGAVEKRSKDEESDVREKRENGKFEEREKENIAEFGKAKNAKKDLEFSPDSNILIEAEGHDHKEKFGFPELKIIPGTLDFERRIIRENQIERINVEAFLKCLEKEDERDVVFVEKDLLIDTFRNIVLTTKASTTEDAVCPRSSDYVYECECRIHGLIKKFTKQKHQSDEVDGLKMETEDDDYSDDESFFSGFRL